MTNPYKIAGPALISFSGGRTSAYMLHEIVRAYDGQLPTDVHVCFANTGKEREETLRFVHECGSRWSVRIRWLEWRTPAQGGFEEVGFNSAGRIGEPFTAMLAYEKSNYLPSAVQRSCTQHLKVACLDRFARSLGWSHWANVIGLRYDEGHRIFKMLARNDAGTEKSISIAPLSKAKVSKPDVIAFWARQPFDLALRSYEGNCDLCFLKGAKKILTMIRENPGIERWWVDMEATAGRRFNKDYSYADLARQARDQGHLFDGFMEDEHDAECGLHCTAEAA